MSIKKYIGAYIAEMGGLDTLVFSGTIGERSFIMRERICQNMEFLRIELDKKINYNTVAVDKRINTIFNPFTPVKVLVVCTDEMKGMAERLVEFNY